MSRPLFVVLDTRCWCSTELESLPPGNATRQDGAYQVNDGFYSERKYAKFALPDYIPSPKLEFKQRMDAE
jgi:hypothetical protein